MAHAVLRAGLQEVARRAGVVAVVFEGIADGFGDDGMRGEVQHGVDAVFTQQAADELAVADLADDQRGIERRLAEARGQVVEHDDPLAAFAQLQDHVAADVAGAAGDEDR